MCWVPAQLSAPQTAQQHLQVLFRPMICQQSFLASVSPCHHKRGLTRSPKVQHDPQLCMRRRGGRGNRMSPGRGITFAYFRHGNHTFCLQVAAWLGTRHLTSWLSRSFPRCREFNNLRNDSKRTSTTFNWTQVRVMEHRHPEAAKTKRDAEGLWREEAANSTPKQN